MIEPLSDLDSFLSRIAASVQVDLMPGRGEPTNALVPQQVKMKKSSMKSFSHVIFLVFVTHLSTDVNDHLFDEAISSLLAS